MNIHHFAERKAQRSPISMVTCYDYSSASIVASTPIDAVLVGDSLAMVMLGENNTISATITQIAEHTRAVAKGIGNQFIVADMPFLSYRQSQAASMAAVHQLMQAGAHAVKIEGAQGNIPLIKHLVESGVPVMGHLGLTPQMVHQLGGFRVQGRNPQIAEQIQRDAQQLSEAGCFALVLECIPATLAAEITTSSAIPTIGIGSGPQTDGQILVWHDLLGLQTQLKPRFVKHYLDGAKLIQQALNQYHDETSRRSYPDPELHTYREQT